MPYSRRETILHMQGLLYRSNMSVRPFHARERACGRRSDDHEMSQLDLNHFGVDRIDLGQLNSPDGQKYNRIGHWYYVTKGRGQGIELLLMCKMPQADLNAPIPILALP
jgi:hypothetical protein